MTSEVAILNKTGVAMATDSAVTITLAGEVTKIYVDANKLFELIKGLPVGIMIYNGAEVDGYPWETLVKTYRTKACERQTDLCGYMDDFLIFTEEYLLSKETADDQSRRLKEAVSLIMVALLDDAAGQAAGVSGKVARRGYLREMVNETMATLEKMDRQEWASGLDFSELWRTHRSALLAISPETFLDATIPKADRRALAKTALLHLLCMNDVPGLSTGLVVAGFGENDAFPSLEHRSVGGLIENRLMVVGVEREKVDHDRPGIIAPYAQTGEATMFLQGISPDISWAITSFWKQWSSDLHKNIATMAAATFTTSSASEMNDFEKMAKEYVSSSWEAFSHFMNQRFHLERLQPIEASAAFLSKREIAELAENLVDLTSLRDRVSINRKETVGGATDVAVISKGDGFVWIKRKHYFDSERNPTWAGRQMGNGVVSELTRQSSDRGSENA